MRSDSFSPEEKTEILKKVDGVMKLKKLSSFPKNMDEIVDAVNVPGKTATARQIKKWVKEMGYKWHELRVTGKTLSGDT